MHFALSGDWDELIGLGVWALLSRSRIDSSLAGRCHASGAKGDFPWAHSRRCPANLSATIIAMTC